MSIKDKILRLFTDAGSYDIPSELYDRVERKSSKMKVCYEDVITMALELWLADSSDIRVKYINLKVEQIKRRVAKQKYLIIDNTQIYYDDFSVYPYIQAKKGIYEVHVDYFLQGIKVAGSIAFDINDL